MAFSKYNFIFGTVASGKSTFLSAIIECLGENSLYIDSDGNRFNNKIKYTTSLTFEESINIIDSIDKEISYYIAIDSVGALYSSRPKIINPINTIGEFINRLPNRHTYFFTMQSSSLLKSNTTKNDSEYFLNISKSISNNFNIQIDDIKIFETIKSLDADSKIEIINHINNTSYNIGNVTSFVRDYKIDNILC